MRPMKHVYSSSSGVSCLPSCCRRRVYHEHHIDRRASRSNAALLFLRQDNFPFAVVAEAARDDLEQVLCRRVPLGKCLQNYNYHPPSYISRCAAPRSWHPSIVAAPRPRPRAHSDGGFVELSHEIFGSPSARAFRRSVGKLSGPNALWFANAQIAASTPCLDRTLSRILPQGGQTHKFIHDSRVWGRPLGAYPVYT